VPFWLIFLTFILSDFLLTKPLGLNTFLVLIITEFVRRNRPAFVEMLFLSEWLVISIILFFASLLKEILLILSLSERNGWIETLQQIGVDIFMYPIVVIFVRIVFQVKKTEKSISYSIRNRT
jgi:cell shape-determining protein MreD